MNDSSETESGGQAVGWPGGFALKNIEDKTEIHQMYVCMILKYNEQGIYIELNHYSLRKKMF